MESFRNIPDLGEFLRIDSTAPEPMRAWDGYASDSYFSGVVVKYVQEYERVVCGLYLS